MLILLCTYFTFSICKSQLIRFINGPIVVTLEKDYRNWVYEPMAITICTNYLHENASDELIQHFQEKFNDSTNHSEDYRNLFNIVGSLNAENVDLIDKIENIDLFLNLSGKDLLMIASKVRKNTKFLRNKINISN